MEEEVIKEGTSAVNSLSQSLGQWPTFFLLVAVLIFLGFKFWVKNKKEQDPSVQEKQEAEAGSKEESRKNINELHERQGLIGNKIDVLTKSHDKLDVDIDKILMALADLQKYVGQLHFTRDRNTEIIKEGFESVKTMVKDIHP